MYYMKKYIVILILILVGMCLYLNNQVNKITKDYITSVENIKAYSAQLSSSESGNRVFKFTIDQLNYSNDSIIQKMKKVQKELGIKDKRLEQLQYELSSVHKGDTLHLVDTVFSDPKFELDTIIGDKWFQNHLYLKYPSTIASNVDIELERYTFINGKRETVSPPKKFFLLRWFQKKHTVVEVQVREMNPYVKNKTQRFVEIIK